MSTCTRDLCVCERFQPHKRFERNCALCSHAKEMHPQRKEASPTRLLYSHLSGPVNHSETYSRLVRIIRESRSTVNLPSDASTRGDTSADSRRPGHFSRNSLLGVRKSCRDSSPDRAKEYRESLSTAASMYENEQIERILLGGKSPLRAASPYGRNSSRSPTPTPLTPSPLHHHHQSHSKSRRSLNVRSNSPLLQRLDLATHIRRHQASVESEYFAGVNGLTVAEKLTREEGVQLWARGEGHKNSVTGAVVTAGKVVSVAMDYCGGVWGVVGETGAQTARMKPCFVPRIHKAPIHSLTIIPDHRLLTSSSDSTIKVWDPGLSRLYRTITVKNEAVYAVAGTSRNQVCAAGSGNQLRMVDIETGQCFGEGNETHRQGVLALVALTPQSVLSGGGDGLLKLWDFRDRCGSSVASLPAHFGRVNCLCASSSALVYSGGDDGVVRRCDLRTLREIETRRKEAPVTGLVWASDCLVICSATLDVESAKGVNLAKVPIPRSKSLTYDEGRRLLVLGSTDCSVSLWRLR